MEYNFEKVKKADSSLSISDFNIKKVIGTGSFGKVVLATKKDQDSDIFAIKMIKKKDMIKRNKIEQTKIEKKLMENLDHPFILELKYAFQDDRKLYLITHFCPGGELYYHISKVGYFNEPALCFYACQVILALEYLHDNRIVYKE